MFDVAASFVVNQISSFINDLLSLQVNTDNIISQSSFNYFLNGSGLSRVAPGSVN